MTRVVKEVMVEVKGKSTQLEQELLKTEARLRQTKLSVEALGAGGDQLGQKFAMAGRQLASATETMARTGNVAGGAAKQMIAAGSNIAFAFGPQGAAIGAMGIFALAVATAMGRTRDEVKRTEEETIASIKRMTNAGDVEGLKGRARDLYLGTPAERFEDGIVARQRRIATLRDPSTLNPFNFLGREQAARKEEAALKPLIAEYEKLQQVITDTANAPLGSRAALPIRITGQDPTSQGKKDAADRKRELEEFERKAEDFARDFRRLVLDSVGDSVDRVAQTFDEMIARAKEVKADAETLGELARLRDQAIGAAQVIARAETLLTEIAFLDATGQSPTVETFQALTAEAEALDAELKKLVPDSKDYLRVQQQLLDVRKKHKDLLDGIADAGGGKGAPKDAAAYAREIQQAADGALQLAINFGLASEAGGQLLRSVSQIAGNLPALSKALKTGSGFDVISAALPILGALSTLAGDSPAERARRDELHRNTEALKELSSKAGLLGFGLGVTGTAGSAAAAGLQGFLSSAEGGSALVSGHARRYARRYGLDLSELDRIAGEYGITLNDSIDSFKQLAEALQDTIGKLGEFGTDLDSQRRQADAEITLFGVSDPLQALGIRNRAVQGRSPAFDQILAGLDLSTAEGRAAARRRAQDLFEVLRAGGDSLAAGALGSLTGDQLLDAILDLVRSLNDIDQSLGLNTSTIGQGDRVITADRTQITADQASRLLGVNTSMLAELRMIREAVVASETGLPVPSLGAGFASPLVPGSGTVYLTINVEVLGSVTSPREIANAVSGAAVDAIDRGLGRRLLIEQRHQGKAVRQ